MRARAGDAGRRRDSLLDLLLLDLFVLGAAAGRDDLRRAAVLRPFGPAGGLTPGAHGLQAGIPLRPGAGSRVNVRCPRYVLATHAAVALRPAGVLSRRT